MNKRFLAVVMAVLLGSATFTGCASDKKDIVETVPVVEENIEEVVEENIEEVVEENIEEVVVEDEVDNTIEEVIDETEVDQETTNSEEVINSEDYAGIDPSVAQEMLFVVTDGIELPTRVNMEAEMFRDTYGIEPSVLASYVVSMPMMNVQSTEIAVFELKDRSNAEAVKTGITKRVNALLEQWKTYLPEQYELVQNYQVVERGNFILFVISNEADAIISKFEAAV